MTGDRTSRGPLQERMTANQPTRGADHNLQALETDNRQSTGEFLLPSLDLGLTLIDIEGSRGVPILQSLVLDHLLTSDGPAFWIDSQGYAATTVFAQLAPSRRLLDRIHVARGFTAYQHYSLLCELENTVNTRIRESASTDPVLTRRQQRQERPVHDSDDSPHTPSLIVVPAVDARYRREDTLRGEQAEILQARGLARLRQYADGYEIPVLLTRTSEDEFAAPIETAADHQLTVEQTQMGPRFVGEDFETLAYPVEGGEYYQTTLAYWREILTARADQVGLARDQTPGSPGATTGRENDTHTADPTPSVGSAPPTPLLDAWTTATGGR